MVDDEGYGLSERLRRIAATVTGDVERQAFLDAAARSLGATIERWGRNPSVRRFLGGVQRDVLTSPGEWIELSASLGVAATVGTRARFYLEDVPVGETPTVVGEDVRIVVRAPDPGIHRVFVDVLDGEGEVVSGVLGHRIVQVASGRPVALVHGSLLVSEDPRNQVPETMLADAVGGLIDAGFEVAYFDIHEKNRDPLIHSEVQRRGLPNAAVLVFSAQEEELRSLGVDFVKMFASTAIRQLRGKGVPVTTILTDRDDVSGEHRKERIEVVHPAVVRSRMREGGFAQEVEQARQMQEARRQCRGIDWRLDQTTDSRLVAGNTFHAELDNARARERVFEAIEGACHSVHLQFYILRSGAFAERLVVELIRRARAGVRVRLMVDALYSDEEVLGRNNPLIKSLKAEPNIEVLALGPIASARAIGVGVLKQRDHRKLIVVDGVRAFVSGRNASDAYYTGFDEVPIHDHTPHERIPWLDAHVEVTGPLVADVQATFVSRWNDHGGPPITAEPENPALAAVAPSGRASGRLIVHRGLEETNGLAMYEAMFDEARDHAYIVNDFPIVPRLERAIVRMLLRGVRVKLLTGSATARRMDGTFFVAPVHRTLFEYMVKARLEPLIRAGLEAYEFVTRPAPLIVARGGCVRPYVHAKLVSVDGEFTSIGSSNLDATASYWESEANVLVEDEAFASEVERAVEQHIAGSLRLDVDSEYWRSERSQRAVVGSLWPDTLYA